MEPNQDGSEVLETTETDTDSGESTEETAEQKLERLAKEKEELEAKNKQLFERAKKAEEVAKGAKQVETDLSPADMLALAKADVSLEDIDEVVSHAKFKGISVKEALATPYIKTYISEQNEMRKTAAATQTGRAARGASKATGEDMLRKAETTGELPDTEEGIMELVRAKMTRNKSH